MKRHWVHLKLRFEAPKDVKLEMLSRRAALSGNTSLQLPHFLVANVIGACGSYVAPESTVNPVARSRRPISCLIIRITTAGSGSSAKGGFSLWI